MTAPTRSLELTTDADRKVFAEFARANPRMAEVLPAKLPSGFVFYTFHPTCRLCRSPVDALSTWVQRTDHSFGANIVETWDVRGMCGECHQITTVYLRFRNNGTYDQLVGNQWRTGVLEQDRSNQTFLDHVMTWARSLWKS